jgi:hypothetical protein
MKPAAGDRHRTGTKLSTALSTAINPANSLHPGRMPSSIQVEQINVTPCLLLVNVDINVPCTRPGLVRNNHERGVRQGGQGATVKQQERAELQKKCNRITDHTLLNTSDRPIVLAASNARTTKTWP